MEKVEIVVVGMRSFYYLGIIIGVGVSLGATIALFLVALPIMLAESLKERKERKQRERLDR